MIFNKRSWISKTFIWPNLVLGLIFLTFASLFFVVPATLPPNSVNLGDNGTTLPHEKTKITSKMPPLQRIIYDFGDSTCHQKSSRSFFINGNQMPICARCTAIYVGLALGILFFVFFYVDIKWWMIVLAILPMGIDGTAQTILGLYESTNLIRVLTGLPAGFIAGAMIGFVVHAFYMEYRIKKEWKKIQAEKEDGKDT